MLEEYKEEQPIAYRILKKIVTTQRYSHAYLIETNGYDKGIKLAIEFANILLSKNGQPIDYENDPELKIINPDGNWIKKEQLMDLQEEFKKKAIVGNKKVYILNQAEKLNVNSANSILKFLEEPQEGIIAILVTDNRYQLLETILSRCQVISLNGNVDILKEKTTFYKIGQIVSNNEEEYNNFVEDENSQQKIDVILKFIKYFENNKQKTILYTNEYWFSTFNDKDLTRFGIIVLLYFYKDVLNYKIGFTIENFNDYEDFVKEVSLKNKIEQLTKKIEIINQARVDLDYNANLNLLIDSLIIKMGGVFDD